MPILQKDEDQDDFVKSLRIYKMKKNQTIYLLENAIYNNVFSTLRNYNYNLKNRNPKILIDTLFEVLIKTTTYSIQTIKQELFALDRNKFDSLRHYLNRTIYL